MNSYSSVDGLPCAGSHGDPHRPAARRARLRRRGRRRLLRGGAAHHATTAPPRDRAAAAAQALAAGLDVELPALDCYRELAAEVGDGPARRSTSSTARCGGCSRTSSGSASSSSPTSTRARAPARVRHAATNGRWPAAPRPRSVVLLTNDGVLPLDVATSARVAVIGPGADDERLLQGDYHYPAHVEIVYLGGAVAGQPAARGVGARRADSFRRRAAPSRRAATSRRTSRRWPALRDRVRRRPRRVRPGCGVTDDDRSGLEAAVARGSRRPTSPSSWWRVGPGCVPSARSARRATQSTCVSPACSRSSSRRSPRPARRRSSSCCRVGSTR